MAETWTDQGTLLERVQALGEWFHNIELCGVHTAPAHSLGDYPRVRWQRFCHAIPEDLSGCTVLDIGCSSGFYALEMKRRGAERVVGIDVDARSLEQARLAGEVTGLEVEWKQLSVYEVGRIGERFDFVLVLGLLCNLRHPLLALDLIHEHVARDLLVLQAMQRGCAEVARMEVDYPLSEALLFLRHDVPKCFFIEGRFGGDPGSWWIPNRACVEAMLRSAGFQVVARPESEVFLCRRSASCAGGELREIAAGLVQEPQVAGWMEG